jgi:hypothetical protein
MREYGLQPRLDVVRDALLLCFQVDELHGFPQVARLLLHDADDAVASTTTSRVILCWAMSSMAVCMLLSAPMVTGFGVISSAAVRAKNASRGLARRGAGRRR